MAERDKNVVRLPWGPMIALALLSGVVLYEVNRESTASAATATTPKKAEPSPTIFAEGRVVAAPGAEVTVAAEMAGRLGALHVTEHQEVKAGELIAEIAATDERAALVEARARLEEAKVDVAYFAKELSRTEELERRGVATGAELDRTRYEHEAGLARIRSLTAAALRLERTLDKARVVAPVSGKVTLQHADAGEFMGVGSPIVTIVDLSKLRVDVEVGEFDLSRIGQATEARITAEGYGGQRWTGQVLRLPDWVTSRRLRPLDPGRPTDTRVLPVEVSLPSEHPLRLGQRVEVELDVSGR